MLTYYNRLFHLNIEMLFDLFGLSQRGVDKLLAQIYFLILSHTEITESTEIYHADDWSIE